MPMDVTGVPVPVLDEQTEMLWWDTANYFAGSLPPRRHHRTPGRSLTPAPCRGTRPTRGTSRDPRREDRESRYEPRRGARSGQRPWRSCDRPRRAPGERGALLWSNDPSEPDVRPWTSITGGRD